MKTWVKRIREDNKPIPHDFASQVVSPFLAKILWQRGLSSAEEIQKFLNPNLRLLEQPDQWPNVNKAAMLLVDNLLAGKKLVVWGDYDVDGVTGVSIVLDVLHHYNIYPLWHLPERFSQGYGLNEEHIEKLAKEGAGILLTVDCGISDHKEVEKALEHNMTVIISDHHLSPENLPKAHAICNPQLADCPCSFLAGVGMAFFLMAEVNKILSETLRVPKFDMRQCLDLVALGSLADMVPLEGQNRILVKNGLLKVQSPDRIGLAALKSVSNLKVNDFISARQTVFTLAPRINAAGRMADPKIGVELFTCKDKDKALKLALKLNDYNDQRKLIERQITEEAILQAEEYKDLPIIFVRHETWNQGIVGIVASRLVEIYGKPSFVFSRDGDDWKASARSIQGFDLHAGLVHCSEHLLSYGGHKMAAGVKVNEENYHKFIDAFNKYFLDLPTEQRSGKQLNYDENLTFADAIDANFRNEISQMQPFGVGNPEPIFLSAPVLVKSHSVFGMQKQHVKLVLQDEQVNLTVKLWNQAAYCLSDIVNKYIQIVFSLKFDNGELQHAEYINILEWEQVEDR